MGRFALLLFALVSPAAFAEEPKAEDIDPTGKPKDYKAGASTRYALWQDADGWHFRVTTTSEDAIAFVGSIRVVGGRISSITPRGTATKNVKTGPDAVPMKSTAPAYNFNVKINRGLEHGIDFTLDDKATAIQCEFKVNGREVPAQIYIGAKGEHPKAGTFRLAVKKE